MPIYLVAANYPAPYRAPENEFRIPVYLGNGQPDLNRAALARAAGLSMVAYDNNGLENQFLQGWLIQDRFLMMTPFGAPYEFLWANPYQPGLSYYQLPLLFHDAQFRSALRPLRLGRRRRLVRSIRGRSAAISRWPRHGGEQERPGFFHPEAARNWATPASF